MKKQLLLLFVLISSQAFAINKCDELAADPLNKNNPQGVIGVEWKDLQAEPAIKACLQALTDEPNNVRYQYQLGRAYYKDNDISKAIKYFENSAHQNYIAAQGVLGYIYQEGVGVKTDYHTAFKWYQKAANQGHAVSQNSLGLMYMMGQGTKKNYTDAIYWFTQANNQDDLMAPYNLAGMYLNGLGVEKNKKQAIKWYKISAQRGNPMANIILKQLLSN